MKAALARLLWPVLLGCNIVLTWWLLQQAAVPGSVHGGAAQGMLAGTDPASRLGALLLSAPVPRESGHAGAPWLPLVPVIVLFGHLLLTGLAVHFTGAARNKARLDWRDLGITGVNELIVLAGGNMLALMLLPPAQTVAAGVLAIAGSVLLLDFAAYWLHRWSHTWQLLWIFHAWHHTCEELSGANAFRFHVMDRIKTELPLVVLVWMLNLPFEGLLWYLSLANAQNINSHSALARHEKMPWQWLLNTPWLHYWHHSIVKAEQKHNFGSILSVWDTLFGTRLDPPLGQQPPRLGTGDVQPAGVIACLLYPFRRLIAGRDWI